MEEIDEGASNESMEDLDEDGIDELPSGLGKAPESPEQGLGNTEE